MVIFSRRLRIRIRWFSTPVALLAICAVAAGEVTVERLNYAEKEPHNWPTYGGGSPITYSVGGKQYIATPSGWGGPVAGALHELWPEARKFTPGATMFAFILAEDRK